MTIKQMIRYLNNQDKPVISYKRFSSNPNDYPTISFCLGGDPRAIYNKGVNELYMSPEEYSYLLKGQNQTEESSRDEVAKIISSDHDSQHTSKK